jgi:DNA polymerase-3 subunit delta
MEVKQAKKKSITEFKSYWELKDKKLTELPNIFIYVSLDSFEFDQITDYYKNLLNHSGEPFEVVVYVSENGDLEKLFSELFNFSMFTSTKLVIIRSGVDFFKPILTAAKKEMFENFKRNISGLSEKFFLLIHYDGKELPAKLGSLLNDKYAIIKSKTFYPEERKRALDDILRIEKITLEADAYDEFLHRIPPNAGAYAKSVLKIKNLLGKKHYVLKDIEDILFPSYEFNPFQMGDAIFSHDKTGFYKELSKLQRDSEEPASFLSLLTALLNRTDEVRKAKLLFARLKDDMGDVEFFKQMGMQSYTDPRKRFVRSRLRKETNLFSEEALSYLYDVLIQLNIRAKSSAVKDERYAFFLARIEKLFLLMEQGK